MKRAVTQGRGLLDCKAGTTLVQSCALLGLVVLFLAGVTLLAAQPAAKTSIINDVGIDQQLGSQIDLNLQFRDESGKPVGLSSYFHGRPVIFAPVYYMCGSLCPMTLNSLSQSLRILTFDAGKDFEVVAFSFDPKETTDMAATTRARFIKDYNRKSSEGGIHFLTGDAAAIQSLTKSLGFRYKWDNQSQQWAHATAIMVATPAGKVGQYFFGLEYSARDLRLSLVQSSAGDLGNVVDQVLLYCYHYDPATGKYGLLVIRTVRLFGAATALALFGFMFVMFRRDARAARVLR
jgi:protein SCO1/2